MAGITIQLANLFRETFKVASGTALLPLARIASEPKREAPPVMGYENYANMSRFQTQVFEQLEIEAYLGEGVEGNKYTFPDTVMIELADRPKNIVRTPMARRDGTVKELVGMDDWRLTIMGFLINNESYDHPVDQVAELVSIYEQAIPYKICGNALAEMGIFQIVMTNLKFMRKRGQPNIQPFVIEAISDDPVELEILSR